ncbi:ABC transporter ATP-binding protein [Enemella sp. A6]|uniref:ABC transporter ATP-binding protein n=1 Tax=Enemella sp. A6 TaxID=3440152 RepID=UPI003EB88950
MSERSPILEVKNLATGYGDLKAVWDVSFEVWPGELTVLLGRNGAGKTTTMRAIAGLNPVQGGSVHYLGRDISRVGAHSRVRNGVAYAQEGKRVFHKLTVEDNLVLGGYTRKESRSALRRDAQRMYELFPILGDKRNMVAGSMSGGQQQMLAIAQALMSNPKLLLLDEPSGGLAPVIVNEVMEQVGRLTETGIGVLLVEQAVEASVRVADHITVLDMGRVVMATRAEDLTDLSVLQDAYFGKTPEGFSTHE